VIDLRHHFGLKRDPFPQDVPVKDLFALPSLVPLEQRVSFAIRQRAISVITGDVGSGKSTSLRYMASRCGTAEYQLISLVGGAYSTVELYRQILQALGTEYRSYQVSFMVNLIRENLLEIALRKIIPVLLIDEAHLFRRSVFSQLHTMAQFEYDSKPVLAMVLCGQDLLVDYLMSPASRPLSSRILGRSHLEALKKEVMENYLYHHLDIAGCSRKIFSEEAVFAIHQASGGLLRHANSLSKTAMLACAMDQEQTVSAEHVRLAASELFL